METVKKLVTAEKLKLINNSNLSVRRHWVPKKVGSHADLDFYFERVKMNKVEMVQRLVEVGLKPKFARALIYKKMKGPYHIKGEIKKTEKIKTIFLLRYLMGPFGFDVAFVNRKERFLFTQNVKAWFDFHKKITKEMENEQNVNENP